MKEKVKGAEALPVGSPPALKITFLLLLYMLFTVLLWYFGCARIDQTPHASRVGFLALAVLQVVFSLITIAIVRVILRDAKRDLYSQLSRLCRRWDAELSYDAPIAECLTRLSEQAQHSFAQQNQLLQDFSPILKEHALLTIMQAEPFTEIPASSVQRVLSEMNIANGAGFQYAILAVRLEAISTLKLNLHQTIYSKFRNVLQFSCEENIPLPYRAHFVWSDHSLLTGVICIPDERNAQDIRDDMDKIGLCLQEQLTLLSEAPVVIAFSDTAASVDGIPTCYQHAKALIQHKLFYQKDTPYTYKQFQDDAIQLSYDQQKRLVEQIKAGRFHEPCEILESYFISLHNDPDTKLDDVKSIAIRLVDSVLSEIDEKEPDAYGLLSGSENSGNIRACETVHEVADRVISIFRYVAEYRQRELQSKKSNRVKEAMDWIDNNYNRDISLDDIARQMNLSTAYASKLIRDHTGMSITTYINTVRLEHAKLLLANTNMSCAEIGEKVGFSHPQSFIRSFNKHVGMTPGTYREANSK